MLSPRSRLPAMLPGAVRARSAPAPGGVRRRGGRVPHDPQDLAAGRPRRRRQRRLRRPGDHGDPDQHRRRRPDQDPQAPRRRRDRCQPQAVLRAQRQHQPAQLPLEPRDRLLLRRRGDDRPRPAGIGQPAQPARRSGPPSSATAGTTCGRRSRSPMSTSTGPTPRTSSGSRRCFPAPAGRGTAASGAVEGRLWGGCLEIVDFNLRAARYLAPDDAAYDGCVLYLETSEEMPTAQYVGEVLMCMGERGLLQRFGALLMGRPKAWSFEHPNDQPGAAGVRRRPARGRARRRWRSTPPTCRWCSTSTSGTPTRSW